MAIGHPNQAIGPIATFGCYTGCDTNPERALSLELQRCGLKGEGEVGEKVWLVKTHFPERGGWKPFKAARVLLLVRNPFDAIDSYFNQTLTNTHSTSLHESQYERFAAVWDGALRNEADVWVRFLEYWEASFVPVLLLRCAAPTQTPASCPEPLNLHTSGTRTCSASPSPRCVT